MNRAPGRTTGKGKGMMLHSEKQDASQRSRNPEQPEAGGAPADKTPVLLAQDLQIGYGKKKVAEGIHFSLHAGRILAVIGPNGSGKSTLLKTAAGFLPALGGKLLLEGRQLQSMSRMERARILSVVTTQRPDVEWMKVWDVAASGRYPYTGRLGVLSGEDRQIVSESLARLQVEDLKERCFRELSDGQKQRVLLAKSLAQRPKLLILDEPTSYLDLRYVLEFVKIAGELSRREHMALMLSLHELSVARKLADRVLTLKEGRQDQLLQNSALTAESIRRLYGIPDEISMEGINGL